MTDDVLAFLAFFLSLTIIAVGIAWLVVLPTIGLLYVAGFLG